MGVVGVDVAGLKQPLGGTTQRSALHCAPHVHPSLAYPLLSFPSRAPNPSLQVSVLLPSAAPRTRSALRSILARPPRVLCILVLTRSSASTNNAQLHCGYGDEGAVSYVSDGVRASLDLPAC